MWTHPCIRIASFSQQSDNSLRHCVPTPISPTSQPSPGAWPFQSSPGERKQKVRRRLEHPREPRENGKPQSKLLGKTLHCACQDTHTSLAKTRKSLPGAFPCLLTLASLGGSGRSRSVPSIYAPLLHLQPCPRMPHRGRSAEPLPVTVPVWEEVMLAMRVSWA